ncbi:MAG: hypothetical protein JWL90_1199 [Chthoniobacteraceae bacterium]|nr:hypothetical protein [Chthoniobacteraceae bacterium]
MQISPSFLTFSLAQALPVPPSDLDAMTGEFSRLQSQFLNNMLPWVLASQLIVILAYWIASRICNPEQGRLTNAIKLWILTWLTWVAIVIAGAVVLYISATQTPSPAMTFASVCVAILLFFTVLFGLPMKVYKISFPTSIGFVVITLILNAAGTLAASRVIPPPIDPQEVRQLTEQYNHLPLVDRKKFTDRITGWKKSSPDEVVAADRSKSIPERHAAVQRIYGELEERRIALKSGDDAALATYSRDEARYQQLLTTLQADAAAAASKSQ